MTNWPMLYDFICYWLSIYSFVGIGSNCVGYSWPATAPEVFVCFPSKETWLFALMGIIVWYILVCEMLGRPLKFLHKGANHNEPNFWIWLYYRFTAPTFKHCWNCYDYWGWPNFCMGSFTGEYHPTCKECD